MGLVEEIEAIEYPGIRNFKWYYHGFVYSNETFIDMLLCGLKCGKLISVDSKGYNGKFYISLSKDMGIKNVGKSSYKVFSGYPRFIIYNIKPIKCSNILYGDYANTILPLRHSYYEDEFQAFWRVKPKFFIGLECSILNWYKKGDRESLEDLKKMIIIMKKLDIKLMVYDYSRCDYDNIHIIDQDKYLTLSKDILDSLK